MILSFGVFLAAVAACLIVGYPLVWALLLGLGLEKFSVPLPMAGRIKHKISQTDLESAKEFAKKVLGAQDEHEIENMLKG